MKEPVPELLPLLFKDLPIPVSSEIKEEQRDFLSHLNGINTSVGIIWNSIDHLEHKSLTELQQFHKVRFFPIGPFHKRAAPALTSFLKEDLSCISWLDKQATNSVLYVSLGSIAVIDGEELTETAWGLANSGQPFLWVVRPNSVVDGVQWDEQFPDGFRENVGERGLIVKWAPQKKVLEHPAVGGFWSHCGWNSTLESICEGVPMICTPRFGDQKINSRYLTDKWKVGIEIENVKNRGDIEKSIRRLMVDEEGKELRERMLKMKANAEAAMEEGGSSYESLNDLTQFISSFSINKGQQDSP